MVKKKNIFQKIYLAVILIMLYLPIGVLIISSVNASEKNKAVWGGFSLAADLSSQANPRCTTLYDRYPCGSGRFYSNDFRNARLYWNDRHEQKSTLCDNGSYKYTDVKC